MNHFFKVMMGIYLPKQKILFAPNMVFIHTITPFGEHGTYYPEFISALDKVLKWDI